MSIVEAGSFAIVFRSHAKPGNDHNTGCGCKDRRYFSINFTRYWTSELNAIILCSYKDQPAQPGQTDLLQILMSFWACLSKCQRIRFHNEIKSDFPMLSIKVIKVSYSPDSRQFPWFHGPGTSQGSKTPWDQALKLTNSFPWQSSIILDSKKLPEVPLDIHWVLAMFAPTPFQRTWMGSFQLACCFWSPQMGQLWDTSPGRFCDIFFAQD